MMTLRRVMPLAAVLALGGCAGASKSAPSGEVHAPPAASVIQSHEGGFSVAFPAPPAEERRTQSTEVGEVTLHTFIASRPDADAAYYVSYTDFPPGAVSQADPRDVVSRASHGALEALGAQDISAHPLTMEGGFPGQEVGGRAGPRRLRGRFFMVGTRLYQQLLLHPEGRPPSDADRFFDSFKLDPRVAAELTRNRGS
ncbi:hypothetical protein KRR26_14030 [Corallococcus sp. M34]|nr:hypothetical protein [Citreicoccus inhibens]